MGLAEPTDKFLVNRQDTTYQINQSELMAKIEDTDYMVLNRGDVVYKITGEDVIDSFIPEIIFTAVILSDYAPKTLQTISATLDVSGGQPPYTIQYEWLNKSDSLGIPETVFVDNNIPTFYIADKFADYEIACRVTLTDNRGSSATQTSDYTNPVELSTAVPVINTVTLSQTSAGTNRFTDETFATAIDMADNGKPASTKTLQAYTDGSFTQALETSPIASVTVDPVDQNSLLTTSDPAGIVNKDVMWVFQPEQQFTSYATVTGDHYIQYMFPEPIIGGRSAAVNLGPVCAMYMQEISTNLTGYGNWVTIRDERTIFQRPNCGGYGLRSTIHESSLPPGTTEIYGFRMRNYAEDAYGGKGMQINFISLGNQLLRPWRWGQALLDDKHIFVDLTDDTAWDYIEPGDKITETGTDKFGYVYKKLDNNRLWLRMDAPTDWTVGATLTLEPKPILNARYYCVLDSSGNVLDLSSSEPAPVFTSTEENPTMEIKFPSTFPGGLTPDEELSSGARLTTEVTASNVVATAGPISDNIVPGGPVSPNPFELEVNTISALTLEYRSAKERVSKVGTLRDSLIQQGFSEAAINEALDETDERVAIDGYFPLYLTEASANAAGDGTSHSHTFNGVTYYMPNGVTFYHGDYNSSDSSDSNDTSSGY